MSDPTQRPNVVHFLPYWRKYLAANGEKMTKMVLNKGKTRFLSKKDRYGLLKALGLTSQEGPHE